MCYCTLKLKCEVDGEENKLLLEHPGHVWLDCLEGVDGRLHGGLAVFFFFFTMNHHHHWNPLELL